MKARTLIPAVLAALALVPGPAAADEDPPRLPRVELVEAWPGAEFDHPIGIVHAGDGSDVVYVLEKAGRVLALPKWRGVGPAAEPRTFLDMRSMVHGAAQGGVLGLAFHPRFAETQKLYVTYLQKHQDPREPDKRFKLVVAELTARGGEADTGSLRPLLEIPKKFPIHQGGRLRFGPDGMLYIATGDGGSKNDADGRAQSPMSYLGKFLRIDVDARSPGKPYGIPRKNPWPDIADRVRPEIWAFGFRNPWGFDWDDADRLWATEPGTTGPESREWITEVVKAGNHAWPFREGTRKLKAPPPHIDPKAFVPTAFEWVRGEGESGTAGVGGRIYRGSRIRELKGHYVFGDFMRGRVYSIELSKRDGRPVAKDWRLLGAVPDVSAIGTDAQGEVYFASYEIGMVLTLARTD